MNVKKKKITFRFQAEDAKEVFLLGDFNSWNPKSGSMKKGPDGLWEKAVVLHPGSYEYKFKVDGQWVNDPANPLTCGNSFGTKNNFVHI
ncbi:MAG: glycoside hydrolase [Desulfobacteraceae bacterium]|nr:glycoside hydrolase [Desulfobacteraceae bacterium]MBU4001473.1 isoamylase early set domain-containing protein [Pseudomonadota bacterium]MBU4054506.1 isoamylase early set domain-containing protein [Pseudomonadota bacterium]